MKIKILGCSGGIGARQRTTAILVDDDVLIDAGTGLGDLSLEDVGKLRHIFLTHAHLDHIAGLPMLVDTVFDQRLDSPLEIYTQAETIAALRDHVFNGVIWPDFTRLPDAADPVLRFNEIVAGDRIELEDREFLAIGVRHAVPTVGFLVRKGDRHVGFSGDTGTNTMLWETLNAVPTLDALIVDVSFPNAQRPLAEHSGHYCPATLAEDLQFLRHDPPIWLTAMKPGFEKLILEEVREVLPGREVRRLMDGDELRL